MLNIFVDADACPVKQEVFRVANRYGLHVTLVSNSWMRIPDNEWIILKIVDDEFDAADDWIVEHIQSDDIVITADIPLASRCLQKGARILGPTGKVFTENNIGQAIATINLFSELRKAGEITGGPPPFKKSDRSFFLQKLDQVIQSINRENPKNIKV
ncbi:YaiI/YqxD family protein [candidate division KSB1 bacterium]|nr:YaiI/YqxD family protein [candidate division KSB1 bacterium]